MVKEKKDVTVIGSGIIDVLACPVSEKVFETGSQPVDMTKISFGGDALNEAIVLARFGKRVDWISKLGKDAAGEMILRYCGENGLDTSHVRVEPDLATAVNIVLTDEKGERRFLTNPRSSLRRLGEEDLEPWIDGMAEIVSFASMFVSERMDIPAMERTFRRIKNKQDRILCADMTKAKHGEKLRDIRGLLPYLDYILPNEDEITLLTGIRDAEENARILTDAGVSCAVIKRGGKGCLIRRGAEEWQVPAYRVGRCVDTTGAGDAFAAGFLWALSEKMEPYECGAFACAAASCAVEQLGATDGIRSLEEPMCRFQSSCFQKDCTRNQKTG